MNDSSHRRQHPRNGWFVAAVALCSGVIAIVTSTLVEASSERDAYQRFSRDVRSTMACVASPSRDEPADPPASASALAAADPSAHRCSLHALSLLEAVRNPAIQRDRAQVQRLAARVRAALESAPADEPGAMASLRQLEPLARP